MSKECGRLDHLRVIAPLPDFQVRAVRQRHAHANQNLIVRDGRHRDSLDAHVFAAMQHCGRHELSPRDACRSVLYFGCIVGCPYAHALTLAPYQLIDARSLLSTYLPSDAPPIPALPRSARAENDAKLALAAATSVQTQSPRTHPDRPPTRCMRPKFPFPRCPPPPPKIQSSAPDRYARRAVRALPAAQPKGLPRRAAAAEQPAARRQRRDFPCAASFRPAGSPRADRNTPRHQIARSPRADSTSGHWQKRALPHISPEASATFRSALARSPARFRPRPRALCAPPAGRYSPARRMSPLQTSPRPARESFRVRRSTASPARTQRTHRRSDRNPR